MNRIQYCSILLIILQPLFVERAPIIMLYEKLFGNIKEVLAFIEQYKHAACICFVMEFAKKKEIGTPEASKIFL